jgi:hypothetical protein
VWIRFKDGRRWKLPEWLPITETRLVELRAAVTQAYKAHQSREDANLGFVPLTFADVACREALELSGLDRMLVLYATYMRVQVADGSWDNGPVGQWRTYPAIYKENDNE